MTKLFIAVATGQNVSNLPPILQFGERGDKVLWLESDLAAKKGWAKGAIQLLDRRGLSSDQQSIDGDINNPSAVQQAILGWLSKHKDDAHIVYIVLNGGQKLTPFGLALAGRKWRDEFKKKLIFIYGDDCPAQLQVYENTIGSQPKMLAYNASRMLSLEEVLMVNGVALTNKPKRIDWNNPPKKSRYGTDVAFTRLVHHYAIRDTDIQESDCNWPPYDTWAEKSKRNFKDKLSKLFKRFGLQTVASKKDNDDFNTSLVKIIREFKPRKPKASIQAENRKQLEQEGWLNGDAVIMGQNFEYAVANRVARYLADRADVASIVRECWLNPQINGAEWDVVIVLVNGIVINLECKSWQAEKKDLDARLRVLRSASGRLARMSVVMPLFKELEGEPSYEHMHKNYEQVQKVFGIAALPLTIPGKSGDEPRFEAELDRLFQAYTLPESYAKEH